jgi:penicillin-binding protein 2
MQPHILKSVVNNEGKTVHTYEAKEGAIQPQISASSLSTVQNALREVVTDGTARSAFRNYPTAVAGKTGTAQMTGKDDYGWFVGYAPADDPQYCVVVIVEQSGASAVTAPAARQIFEQLFGQEVQHITATDNPR